jgi:hypothetical protein
MSKNADQATRVVNIVVPAAAGYDMSEDQIRDYVASLVQAGEQAAIGQGSRGYWEEDPDHPAEDWRYAVANGDTRHGYWEWVGARKAEAAMEAELPEPKGPVAIGEVAEAVPPKVIIDANTDNYSSAWGLYADAPVAVDIFEYQEFRASLEEAGPEGTEGVSPELRDLALKHGIPFGPVDEYISEMMELLKEQEMPCPYYGHWVLADENGWTLAHQAAKYGHLPAIGFHEWSLKDKDGVTVRDVAKEVISKSALKPGM